MRHSNPKHAAYASHSSHAHILLAAPLTSAVELVRLDRRLVLDGRSIRTRMRCGLDIAGTAALSVFVRALTRGKQPAAEKKFVRIFW